MRQDGWSRLTRNRTDECVYGNAKAATGLRLLNAEDGRELRRTEDSRAWRILVQAAIVKLRE